MIGRVGGPVHEVVADPQLVPGVSYVWLHTKNSRPTQVRVSGTKLDVRHGIDTSSEGNDQKCRDRLGCAPRPLSQVTGGFGMY